MSGWNNWVQFLAEINNLTTKRKIGVVSLVRVIDGALRQPAEKLLRRTVLEIKTGSDTYERGDRHAPNNRVGFIDWPHENRQDDPIF